MVNIVSCRLQQCFGPFTVLPVIGLSEQDVLDNYRPTYFGVRRFGSRSAMRAKFFENVQNLTYISKMLSNIQKIFFVSEVSASKLVALNCLY